MKPIKAIIFIIAIIVIAIAIFISLKVFNRPEYTLQEIQNLINKEIPENVFLKVESYDSNNNGILTSEIYVKGDRTYSHQIHIENGEKTIDEERLFNYANNSEIRIDHHYTSISLYPIDDEYNINPFLSTTKTCENFLYTTDKYKYLGTENLNGKECIKIVDSSKNSNLYIYISKEDNRIIRIESYQDSKVSKLEESDVNDGKFPLAFTIECTYSYNTVTDDDIPEFNINNYPDYTYDEYKD